MSAKTASLENEATKIEKDYKTKSKKKVLLIAEEVTNYGGFLLIPTDKARAMALRDPGETKRLRSKCEALKPLAARDDLFFLIDELKK